MKKRLSSLLMVTMALGMLAGCTDKKYDNTSQNLSDIDIDQYVLTLGEYKGLEISGTKQVVTDEYVDSYIDYMLENSKTTTEVTGRAVQTGDVVNINYVGKIDGEEFQGGTDDSEAGSDLTIGSGKFIEGFEDGLIGANVGDTVDVNLTFPENYTNTEVAGKPVVFTVTINKISEQVKPELNDEYVQSLQMEDCTTVEQFKQAAKESLENNAENTYQSDLQTKAMDALMDKCEFAENPPEGIMAYYKEMINENFKNEAASQNMSVTDFITAYYGMTEDQYNAQIEIGAKTSANQAMVCMKIAQKEKLTVSDEELDEAIGNNYANFGYASAEDYKAKANVEDYRDYLLTSKVLKFLVDNAVVTEETETETAVADSEAAVVESEMETETGTTETETATE